MLGSQLVLTASREGATLRLSLAGEFDRAGGDRLERACEAALDLPTDHLVIDLAAVTFLAPGAVKSLLKAHARARAYGIKLTAVRPPGTARRVFTLTRVGDALPVADAIGAFGSSALHRR